MFDAIAPRYDLLNRVLSAGIDRRWRARAIQSLRLTGREVLLDVCTGTADVALQAEAAAHVIGVDFAGAMLAVGRQKVRAAGAARRILLVRGDATQLPVRDGSVDAVTDCLRYSQRRTSGIGLRRACAGDAAWKPARDSGVRRAAAAGDKHAIPLVLQVPCCPGSAVRFPAIAWRTRTCPHRSAAFRRPRSFSLCWSGVASSALGLSR